MKHTQSRYLKGISARELEKGNADVNVVAMKEEVGIRILLHGTRTMRLPER